MAKPKPLPKEQIMHPMKVYTGVKTFTIVQKALTKDDLYGCVEFSKALLSIDPSQSIEDYKGTLLHEICHIGFDLFDWLTRGQLLCVPMIVFGIILFVWGRRRYNLAAS